MDLSEKLTFLYTGDVGPGGDDTESYFVGVKKMLEEADVRAGQFEVPYVNEASEYVLESKTTKVLTPLIGRFDVMTFSSNHTYDLGPLGVKDSIDWLKQNNILYTGAGMNIKEACTPAIFEKEGVRFGFLGYNAYGPKMSFAAKNKPGAAYIGFTRAYIPLNDDISKHDNDLYDFKKPIHIEEQDVKVENFIDIKSYMKMADEIANLKQECDIVSVYFHKGRGHTRAEVADYERFLCHVAVDAGADVIFASHAHLLRGCEIYKGVTIYHGLNNLVLWAPGLNPNYKGPRSKNTEEYDGEEWVRRRQERFGFIPDPTYVTYPFHPESIYTIAAKCIIEDGKITETRFVPIIVEKPGIPFVVGRNNGGERVLEYMNEITEEANLNCSYEWDGDELVIREKKKL